MQNHNINTPSQEGQTPHQGQVNAGSSHSVYEHPNPETNHANDSGSPHSHSVAESAELEPDAQREPARVQTLPGLRERSLTAKTRQRFALVEVYRTGIQYPTPRFNPAPDFNTPSWLPGGGRLMNTYALNHAATNHAAMNTGSSLARFSWLDVEARVQPRPAFYGTPAFATENTLATRVVLKNELWIVANEAEVWALAECGLEAMCPLGDDLEPLGEFLAEHAKPSAPGKGPQVFILCTADPQWRKSAARLQSTCRLAGVMSSLRALQGPRDVAPKDASALFAHLKFNTKALCDEMSGLPFVPHELARVWESEPEREWPAAPREDVICVQGETLEALSAPQYLVEGLLLASRPNLLTGREETGKSIITLAMALCICRGLPWLGRVTLQGDVFYVAGEGAGGVRKRKTAWEAFYGQERVDNFHLITHPLDPSNPQARQALLQVMARHSQNPVLVVFDTLSLCFEGDEDKTGEMGHFIKGMEAICRATGAACLALHHHNRQDEYRGSSVLTGNCEVHLTLTREDDVMVSRGGRRSGRGAGQGRGAGSANRSGEAGVQREVRLRVAKLKDSVPGLTLPLRPLTVEVPGLFDARGNLETSAVFVPVEASADVEGTESGAESKEEEFWPGQPSPTGVTASRGENSSGNQSTTQGQSAARNSEALVLQALGKGSTSGAWFAQAAAQGVSKSTFDRARRKLTASGLVECEAPGQAGAIYVPTASKP